MRHAPLLLLPLILGSVACRTTAPEATSLLGTPLFARDVLPQDTAPLEADLERARRVFERGPEDEEAAIWYGRRLAYLARYREAQDVFTNALDSHPRSFRLLRHRGHRWITLRELRAAVTDLARAERLTEGVPDEVEEDGAPNPLGIPRSTTQGNIAYHLGLAHHLLGDFEASVKAYRRCLDLARNDDSVVSAVYWIYLGLRCLGRDDEARAALAPVRPEMDVLENDVYHQLCVFFKGDLTAEELIATVFANEASPPLLDRTASDPAAPGRTRKGTVRGATFGYGYGTWLLCEGRRDEAQALYRDIVDAGTWNAFGHIAAEAELARLAP